MTGGEDHIIGKSILRIKVSDQATAYQTQTEVLAWFQQELQTTLAGALDLLSMPGQVIQLDKVELDLGKINLKQSPQAVQTELGIKFREAVEKAIQNAIKAEDGKIRNADELDWERLLRFLHTGSLNWDTADKGFKADDLLGKILRVQPMRFKAYLPQLVMDDKAFERLTLQFSANNLNTLLALFNPRFWKLHGNLMQALELLGQYFAEIPASQARRKALVFQVLIQEVLEPTLDLESMEASESIKFDHVQRWIYYLRPRGNAATHLTIKSVGDVLRQMPHAARLKLLKSIPETKLFATLLENVEAEPLWTAFVAKALPKAMLAILENWPASQQNQHLEIAQTLYQQLRLQKPENVPNLRAKLDDIFGTEPPQKTSKAKKEASSDSKPKGKPKLSPKDAPKFDFDEAAQYIDNAGIVLLNPFFQPCFEDLGWMQNGQFLDEAAQENAAMLLSYLVTGETEVGEASLPLIKILCGIEADRPLRAQIDLPQRALDETKTLLSAANAHWEKAGKLSPDQFRAAFLQREGRLKGMETGINLKVDRQTHDILLEFLPWSFGTIMLPWMRTILTVDW